MTNSTRNGPSPPETWEIVDILRDFCKEHGAEIKDTYVWHLSITYNNKSSFISINKTKLSFYNYGDNPIPEFEIDLDNPKAFEIIEKRLFNI